MNASALPRVVVTGIGCVTALGGGISKTWEALCAGRSARSPITAIPVEGCRVTEGAQAEVPELPGYSAKRLSRFSRASRLAIPAMREALAQAGLLDVGGRCMMERLELSVSTTACGMEKGEEFLKAVWSGDATGQTARVAHYQAQQQIGEMQRHFGFGGPAMIVANACAGGANAIGHALDLLRIGAAEIVLAGGYEALCELVFAGFDGLQSLAPEACRPFDVNRNGLMLGEGAAFLVMESEARARQRHAEILGYVTGYGFATDLNHLTQPAQDGGPLECAIRMALAEAEIAPPGIGYINAHGTGTPLNDGAEAAVFARVFGGSSTKISSTKAAMGHALGAAGAIEAALCLMALRTEMLPPQINLQNPEPAVAEALVAPKTRAAIDGAMSVNLGFGGSNAALTFARP